MVYRTALCTGRFVRDSFGEEWLTATRPAGFVMLAYVLLAILVFTIVPFVQAETPAPSVHWGSIAYPDQFNTVQIGGTFNRFSEFDGTGARYHSTINESFGLNFATASWSQHWQRWPGWSSNLTLGIGPTGAQPTEYIQNSVTHPILGNTSVPVGRRRQDVVDGMVDGSVTRWFSVLEDIPELFLGGGFSVGTLYYEEFARIGARRVSFESFIPYWDKTPLHYVSDWLRGSAMARYGALQSSGLIHNIKPYSFVYQLSLSVGPYGQDKVDPHWEIEFALTWDSGIFVDETGQSRKEFFWSIAATYAALRMETWNDSLNQKDLGPTYGFTVTLDLLKLFGNM
jgi:hypothetical protein